MVKGAMVDAWAPKATIPIRSRGRVSMKASMTALATSRRLGRLWHQLVHGKGGCGRRKMGMTSTSCHSRINNLSTLMQTLAGRDVTRWQELLWRQVRTKWEQQQCRPTELTPGPSKEGTTAARLCELRRHLMRGRVVVAKTWWKQL